MIVRRKSPRLTAEIAAKIKALHKHTDMNHAQIAAHLGAMNQGRVSEVINGARYSDVPPCNLDEALHGTQ